MKCGWGANLGKAEEHGGDVRSGPSRSRAAGQRHAPLARKPPARVEITGSRCVRVDYGGIWRIRVSVILVWDGDAARIEAQVFD